jgi:hypothetical protein
MKMIFRGANFSRSRANFAGFADGNFFMPQGLPVFQGISRDGGDFLPLAQPLLTTLGHEMRRND